MPTQKFTPPHLYLFTKIDTPNPYGDSRYGHVRLTFVQPDKYPEKGTHPYGFSSSDEYDQPFRFQDLEINSQLDHSHARDTANYPGPWAYGWEVRYDDARFIELKDAEKMVKTLRFVHHGLDKLTAQFGYPQTFDEYVVRVAAVFRCPGFIIENTHEVQDYTGERYHLFPLADLRWHVREALNHVHETLKTN